MLAVAAAASPTDSRASAGLLEAPMPRRVLIADDHPMMRTALGQTVAGAFPGCEVLEAEGFEPLRALLAEGAEPELILLDLNMPGASGFIGLMMVRSERPEIPVIVVSAADDPETIRRAIDYGAAGFVPKSAPAARLAEAIRTVSEGGVWTPVPPAAETDPEAGVAARAASLTPQQLRVLAGMAAGRLNKQIAYDLGVSEQTVKDHVTVILRKLGAQNRTQAVLVAARLALRPPPD